MQDQDLERAKFKNRIRIRSKKDRTQKNIPKDQKKVYLCASGSDTFKKNITRSESFEKYVKLRQNKYILHNNKILIY